MNWSQLRTVLWLRWRLSRSQFSRGGKFNAVVRIIGIVISIAMVLGSLTGGILGGAFGLAHASPMIIMLVWDIVAGIFLFFWLIGVLADIQRAESIDLARLLHLPVSLPGIFVMNYIASHMTPSIIIFLPGMIGLSVGLIWSKGILMFGLFPLGLTFIFLITAWTYYLRGWLVALMVNPRRRRNVFLGIGCAIVLVVQLPNLYFNIYLHHGKGRTHHTANPANLNGQPKVPDEWLLAHSYVPILWLPNGAMALAEGNVWPAVAGSLGALLLGAMGLTRAYRATLRFYLGQEKTGKASVLPAKLNGVRRKNFMETRMPMVSEDVAALSLAFFRSLSRAPEIKMQLFANLFALVVLVPFFFLRGRTTPSEISQLFYATGAVGFTFFGLLQPMFNVFGYDREGFRLLVLSPMRRRDVLLAKNISLAPVAFFLGLALLIALVALIHLPLFMVAAALFKLIAIFLLLSLAGNLISIWVPCRVVSGSLKPTKPPAKTILLAMATQLLFPVVMIPVFIPPALGLLSSKFDWWPAPVVDALLSGALAIAAIFAYRLSLRDLGEMMERREQRILLVVTRENE